MRRCEVLQARCFDLDEISKRFYGSNGMRFLRIHPLLKHDYKIHARLHIIVRRFASRDTKKNPVNNQALPSNAGARSQSPERRQATNTEVAPPHRGQRWS
jgi:hypothetical protein